MEHGSSRNTEQLLLSFSLISTLEQGKAMKNFYFSSAAITNSWFMNSDDVIRVERYTHCQIRHREMANIIREMFPAMPYCIAILEPREEASEIFKNRYGSGAMMPYDIFTFYIEGKDHCGEFVRYTFVIGVNQSAGMTCAPRSRAFIALQRALMGEKIGCLKLEAESKLIQTLHYGEFDKLPF